MHREGHVGAALLLYAPLGFLAAVVGATELAILGTVVAAGLSMLPDVDMKIPLLRHRGPTHTVGVALVVGLAVGVFGWRRGVTAGPRAGVVGFAFGFLVGALSIASHLVADALTPAGIRPFWPFSNRVYSYHVVRAANPVANWVLLALGVLVSGLALGLADAVT